MGKIYQIGEVSKITGLNASALRYYDKVGLLTPKRLEGAVKNHYRVYDDDDVERINKISMLSKMGYGLKEIKQILDNSESEMEQFIIENTRSLEEERKRLENKIKFNYLLSIAGTRFLSMKSFVSRDTDTLMQICKDKFEESAYYHEIEQKKEKVTQENVDTLMQFFERFADQYQSGMDFRDEKPLETAEKCYTYFSEHFLNLSLDDFSLLACFLGGGGLITSFLNHNYGKYTAEFAMGAFLIFCKNNGIPIDEGNEEELCHE